MRCRADETQEVRQEHSSGENQWNQSRGAAPQMLRLITWNCRVAGFRGRRSTLPGSGRTSWPCKKSKRSTTCCSSLLTANRPTAAGLRRIKFHDLWHTCATLLLQAGESVHVVAQ